MKQKDIWIYAGVTIGAIAAIVFIHRYITGRQKIEALKKREMDPNEEVADVQTNFENNK